MVRSKGARRDVRNFVHKRVKRHLDQIKFKFNYTNDNFYVVSFHLPASMEYGGFEFEHLVMLISTSESEETVICPHETVQKCWLAAI